MNERIGKVPALSIRVPWATMIVKAIKDVENRGWAPNYKGPLIIHASKTIDKQALGHYADEYEWINGNLATGCLIGHVILDRVSKEQTSPWHMDGKIGLYLKDAVEWKNPLPWRGQPSIFWIDVGAVPEFDTRYLQKGNRGGEV